MKPMFVEEIRQLPDNGQITEVVLALVNSEKRTDRNGKPFLSLTLSDRTGLITGNKFDCDILPQGCKIGEAVLVEGTFNSRFNSITIQRIAKHSGSIDRQDFIAPCPKDVDAMLGELFGTISSLGNASLRRLLLDIFEDNEVREKFRSWPAAQVRHHAYIGGLLAHTLTVAKLSQRSAEFYDVDKELLVAGALLHDIGKIQEFDCGLTTVYTDKGNLFGHILLGASLVRDKISAISNFPERLSWEILHIIGSHHGRREWGAIVEPMTLEAFLVFIFDYADSKADRYQTLIHEQRPLEQNISPWDSTLETRVYAPKLEEGR